jgi:HSP20 family molecular chaperone IbpA
LPSGIGNLETKEVKSKSFDNLSSEKLKKFSKLPKEEPKTNIRRLSNKVIYEVDLPGVKSAKDISILNLEKGIELKAVSEKKAYLKSIPITLPILAYKLSKGKLFLELDAHED